MKSNKKIIKVKQAQPKKTDFYRDFEERFRGTRADIASRLQVYLPFVEPLKTIDITPIALDLGCGRGEWLELLQNNGFKAKGVDLDESMLSACLELNLDVHLGDALDYLRGLDSESLSVISAFHMVEHIAFEMLRELSAEAYRVLKPGGLLIFETPNSENLMVGTSSFYLDHTHQKPLPAPLLSFVVEYAGFNRIKTLYLQDSPELVSAQQTSLVNVLGGVSPDYAIVAQKDTSPAMAALFNEPFEHSYGLRLEALAARYDQQTLSHTQWLQSVWDIAKQHIEALSNCNRGLEVHNQWLQQEWDASKLSNEQLQVHNQWLQQKWDASKLSYEQLQVHNQWLQQEWDASKLSNEQLQVHGQWLQQKWDASKLSNEQLQVHNQWLQQEWDATKVKIIELEQERKNLYASSSWRITKPLRLLSLGVTKFFKALLYIPKTIWYLFKWPFKLMLTAFIRYAIKHPAIKSAIRASLTKHPKLYTHALLFARARGINIGVMTSSIIINKNQHAQTNTAQALSRTVLADTTTDLTSLSPRARRIYLDLKDAMDSNNKEYS